MENKIGMLHISSNFDHNEQLFLSTKEALRDPNYLLIEITEKEAVGSLDGLIINLEKTSDSVQVFQWLIDLQEEHSLFIWILCGEEESELIKLCPYLSKNSVIEILRPNQSIETLGIVIKNALNYKKHLLNLVEHEKKSVAPFLDASKLSLVVHNTNIPLTRKEFKIIALLYRNLGNVVTYKDMNKEIYGDLPSKEIAKYRVANFIFSIRNKLKEQNYFEIGIVRTKGYILTCSENEEYLFSNTSERAL